MRQRRMIRLHGKAISALGITHGREKHRRNNTIFSKFDQKYTIERVIFTFILSTSDSDWYRQEKSVFDPDRTSSVKRLSAFNEIFIDIAEKLHIKYAIPVAIRKIVPISGMVSQFRRRIGSLV